MRKLFIPLYATALLAIGTSAALAQPTMLSPLQRLVSERQQSMAGFFASLNLTAAQKAQAQALQQSAKEIRIQAFLAATVTAELVKRDLADPQADLHQTAQMLQSTVDTHLAAHRRLTAERLRFYDSLSPSQQALVRAEIIERIERIERLQRVLLDLAGELSQ